MPIDLRLAALALLLLPGAALAQKAPDCAAFPADADRYACLCGPGPHAGSVWGGNPYTADSDLCTAAVHAGALGEGGGPILALRAEGQDSYPGTLSNGIQSRNWGPFETSFTFPARGAAGVELCRPLRSDEASLSCQCPPEGQGTRGAVWGSGPYTADSDACAAAIHSGVIGPEGGTVRIEAAEGLDAYPASSANGIESSAWGAYDRSITVSAP